MTENVLYYSMFENLGLGPSWFRRISGMMLMLWNGVVT